MGCCKFMDALCAKVVSLGLYSSVLFSSINVSFYYKTKYLSLNRR